MHVQVRTHTNLIRSHERIKFAVRLDFAIGLILTAFYYTHENHQRTHGTRFDYSVIHISIHPSKELFSKMAPGEVGMSLP